MFLSLVLTRTFSIILDLIHTQEEYSKLKKAASSPIISVESRLRMRIQTAATSKINIGSGDQARQIEELKKKLAESEGKNRDIGSSDRVRLVSLYSLSITQRS